MRLDALLLQVESSYAQYAAQGHPGVTKPGASPPSALSAAIAEPDNRAAAIRVRLRTNHLLEDEDKLGLYRPLVDFTTGNTPDLSCSDAIVRCAGERSGHFILPCFASSWQILGTRLCKMGLLQGMLRSTGSLSGQLSLQL